jgi:hypothetical protein
MKKGSMPELVMDGPSLYDLLAELAPAGAFADETGLTLTKETVDGDAEDVSDDDVIYGRGG